MRKIIAIALFLILATFLVAFGGCEEETREHVTVLIYQKKSIKRLSMRNNGRREWKRNNVAV